MLLLLFLLVMRLLTVALPIIQLQQRQCIICVLVHCLVFLRIRIASHVIIVVFIIVITAAAVSVLMQFFGLITLSSHSQIGWTLCAA